MDALDKAILDHLEFDGRSSMQDLSELTGLSRSAVFSRVKRLEDQGIIAGYTVKVNRKKLGMEIRSYCNITLKLHERELLEEFEGRGYTNSSRATLRQRWRHYEVVKLLVAAFIPFLNLLR